MPLTQVQLLTEVIQNIEAHPEGVGANEFKLLAQTLLDIINNVGALSGGIPLLGTGTGQLAAIQSDGTLTPSGESLADINISINNAISTAVAEASSVVQITKVTLSSTQILALNTSPVLAIPAPGVGKVVVVLNVTLNMIQSGLPYTTNAALSLVNGAGSPLVTLSSLGTSYAELFESAGLASISTSDMQNSAISIKNITGNPAGGTNTANVYIAYFILTL